MVRPANLWWHGSLSMPDYEVDVILNEYNEQHPGNGTFRKDFFLIRLLMFSAFGHVEGVLQHWPGNMYNSQQMTIFLVNIWVRNFTHTIYSHWFSNHILIRTVQLRESWELEGMSFAVQMSIYTTNPIKWCNHINSNQHNTRNRLTFRNNMRCENVCCVLFCLFAVNYFSSVIKQPCVADISYRKSTN